MAVTAVLGGDLAWVADNDPSASAVLAHRFPSVPNLGDIAAVDWAAVEPVDIVCAGFPCQDISYAGAGEGIQEGNRSGLWYTVADAVGVLRPRLVVLENVAAIVGRRPGLDVVLGSLAALGFDAEWACVRAADVGAPHGRDRWFAVAYPHGAAWDQRWLAAPGQAQGGWSWPDTGGRGGASAADAERDGRKGRQPAAGTGTATVARRPSGGDSAVADADCGGCPAGLEPSARRRKSGRASAPVDSPGSDGNRPAADSHGDGRSRGQERDSAPVGGEARDEQRRVDPLRRVLDWGRYAAAIRRWEAALGRPAPRPTVLVRTGDRLNPAFVEWMLGLPAGWVTNVPGLGRNDMLRILGNGVIPQQAAAAIPLLLQGARTWSEAA